MIRIACLAIVLATLLPHAARAALVCVDTPAALATALESAEANGEDDDIRIVAGSYALPATLVHSTHEAFALVLSGGWNAGCTARGAAFTTLDGGGSHRVLHVSSDATGDLAITDILFSGGWNDAAIAGGALAIETSSRDVLIERNVFAGNEDTHQGGAARIAVSTSNSLVTVRNNVVLGNSAPEAAGLVINASIGDAYVVNNTIVANTTSIAGALCGGLCISGGSDFTLSNNILWSNPAGDLHIGNTGAATLLHNDIGSIGGGSPGPGSTGNLDVDPGFAPGLLNLRLAADSPLVDAGLDSAPGGVGPFDLGGAVRVQGAHVDIGAYETDDSIFDDGFESSPAEMDDGSLR